MATIRVDVSALVGLILQAPFFGIYQLLFVGCIYVLLSNKKTRDINWPILITAIVMWILIGIYFVLCWSRIMDAFIGLQSSLAHNPDAISEYFENLSLWKEVFRSEVYLVLTVVADSLFIYRLYVVWGKEKLITVLPIAMLCASITSAIVIALLISSATSRLFSPTLGKWLKASFSISLAQNILTTFLIIFRIWRVSNGISSLKRNSLWPVVIILLESGAIYSSTLFVLLVTYALDTYAQYIVIDVLVPIIGITFNLIIVRVGLGMSHIPTNSLANTTHPVFNKILPQQFTISISQHIQTSRETEQKMTPGITDAEEDASFQGGEWKIESAAAGDVAV